MEITGFLLGLLSSDILIIISQIIWHYFARKNLKAQQEHSKRIVRIQLYHEDKKKALIEIKSRLGGLKDSMRNRIKKYIYEE